MSQWLVQCAKSIEIASSIKSFGNKAKSKSLCRQNAVTKQHQAVHRCKDYQNAYAHNTSMKRVQIRYTNGM